VRFGRNDGGWLRPRGALSGAEVVCFSIEHGQDSLARKRWDIETSSTLQGYQILRRCENRGERHTRTRTTAVIDARGRL
jgi:hypothetical protein